MPPASAFGAATFGASAFGASAFGAATFGASAFGASAFGASAFGASTFALFTALVITFFAAVFITAFFSTFTSSISSSISTVTTSISPSIVSIVNVCFTDNNHSQQQHAKYDDCNFFCYVVDHMWTWMLDSMDVLASSQTTLRQESIYVSNNHNDTYHTYVACHSIKFNKFLWSTFVRTNVTVSPTYSSSE
jgi:PPE-repeat protein